VKLDEAIVEEFERAGPGSRPELTRRLADRMAPALSRLTDAGILYPVSNSPDRPVNEKVYSLSPDLIDWSPSRSRQRSQVSAASGGLRRDERKPSRIRPCRLNYLALPRGLEPLFSP
jgi:hypothetical protein